MAKPGPKPAHPMRGLDARQTARLGWYLDHTGSLPRNGAGLYWVLTGKRGGLFGDKTPVAHPGDARAPRPPKEAGDPKAATVTVKKG